MTITHRSELTQLILKNRLFYKEETGIFTWINSNRCGWNGKIAGCKRISRGKFYIIIKIDGIAFAAHQLAWLYKYGYFPPEIDHKNGNSLDNKILNLKPCTHTENAQNHVKERKKGKLPCGVRETASGKYMARITCNKQPIILGLFSTIPQAQDAYAKARISLHYCPAREFL